MAGVFAVSKRKNYSAEPICAHAKIGAFKRESRFCRYDKLGEALRDRLDAIRATLTRRTRRRNHATVHAQRTFEDGCSRNGNDRVELLRGRARRKATRARRCRANARDARRGGCESRKCRALG